MVGVASFKPQTSLSASARAAIVGEAHKLIAAGRVAFGRKHAV